MSFIQVTNESAVPLNVALYWSNVVQQFKNELAPRETVKFEVGAGWHDLIATIDTENNRFSFDANVGAVTAWGATVGGLVVAAVGVGALVASGGASAPVTVPVIIGGIATAVGAGVALVGAAEIVGDAWLHPATVKGLFAPDGHDVRIRGGSVEGNFDPARNTIEVTKIHQLYAEATNETTGYTLFGTGWDGTRLMTAIGETVYAISGDRLLAFQLGHDAPVSQGDGWAATVALTAMNGRLYAVHQDILYEKVPGSASRAIANDWTGTVAMTAMDGKLYIVHRDTLYEKAPDQAARKLSDGWTGTTAMTALWGRLFVVHQDTLYEKAPDQSAKSRGTGWGGTVALAASDHWVLGVKGGARLHGLTVAREEDLGSAFDAGPRAMAYMAPPEGSEDDPGWFVMVRGDQLQAIRPPDRG